jgi:hypothetical protein
LIHITGNRAVPGLWLSFAAGCGLLAAIFARPQAAVTGVHYQSPDVARALTR